jgi:hypothetical protein
MKVLLTMFNTVETHHKDRFIKVRLQQTNPPPPCVLEHKP